MVSHIRQLGMRGMIDLDRPAVERLQQLTHGGFAMSWPEVVWIVNHPDGRGMTAKVDELTVGMLLWWEVMNHRCVLDVVVAAAFRRQGIGAAMLYQLLHKRGTVTARVRESNCEAQAFFLAQGFRATEVVPSPWPKCPHEDGYEFRFQTTACG